MVDEEEAIGFVIMELRNEEYKNIIVVDGYSADKTAYISNKAGASIIMQHGSGKTNALKTAFKYVETPYLIARA